MRTIQNLDVSEYNEAEVRAEIIDPLLRVLGYEKETYFSIDREKRVPLLGSDRFLDYSMTLWSENFWLIEAKSAKRKRAGFDAADIAQAVGYAVLPEINAALVVLCDGRHIAVFDREHSQTAAMLTVEVRELEVKVDELRAVLSPWQVWFFEKRRILRQLDRVFGKEFNLERVEEFKSLVSELLDRKRQSVLENMRTIMNDPDREDETTNSIRSSGPVDLIEGWFMMPQTALHARTIAETLVGHCDPSSFSVLYRMFPDTPRSMNDHYCMHALDFLIRLHRQGSLVQLLPHWLGGGRDLAAAVERFIELCITHFSSDPARRTVLLCAAALRRLLKLRMVADTSSIQIGETLHALNRHFVPEDAWAQLLSSPPRELLLALDTLTVRILAALMRRCSDAKGHLKPEMARQELRAIWQAELATIEAVPNYADLVSERELQEICPTEAVDVVYDQLGHAALCVINEYDDWKQYVLATHRSDVETLARMGSWQARRWLSGGDSPYEHPADQVIADRFFLGDVQTFQRLREAYQLK